MPNDVENAIPAVSTDATPDATPPSAVDAGNPVLEQLRAANAELRDRLLRTAAELENTRKRSQREIAGAANAGRDALLRGLLDVTDNLSRALQHASPGPLTTGVRLVEQDLLRQLERFGVTRFSAKGAPFDPARHEAVEQVETGQLPPGTVTAEFAAGYLHEGRLFRPARVAVARAPSTTATVARTEDA